MKLETKRPTSVHREGEGADKSVPELTTPNQPNNRCRHDDLPRSVGGGTEPLKQRPNLKRMMERFAVQDAADAKVVVVVK